MEKRILANKTYLYITEFFSGMSVMAVELGASRLLAPYFSSSQIVWTIIIGTIMIAMALGNVFGGRLADRENDPDKLYGRILIAAIWICLIPVVGKYIIIGVSALLIFSINQNFLIAAAFVSCMLLFVYPLFLLGMVTPSLVKYAVSDLKDSGRTVGLLSGFNTIGSIIGTFLPTFVTIPAIGTALTFLAFALILTVICAVYFISEKTHLIRVFIAFLVCLLGFLFARHDSFAFWETDLAYEGESIYNYLQVREDARSVTLSTNVLFGVQSVYVKDGSLTGMYYDYALMAPYMADANRKDGLDILVLGMGTGTFATQCRNYLDAPRITGVEIDADITALSRAYFHLDAEVPVVTYDGRAYLNSDPGRYDVIMVDAYQDITIPFQMSSVEFFSLVKQHLKEDGVLVINLNMRSDREGDINHYLSDTIASVFAQVYTVEVGRATNRELFASDGADLPEVFAENMALEGDAFLRENLSAKAEGLARYEAGSLLLTDDKAPVELLGMRVIDDIIADEVDYYRAIYEKDGLDGLFDIIF